MYTLSVEKSVSNSLIDKPVFIISLDTELAWGFILEPRHKFLALLQSEPARARGTIDLLLNLFEKYDIPATWAVVGHLFLNSDEGKVMFHQEMPQFKEGWLDWDFYSGIRDTPLYYGRDMVEKILANSVKHEIGLHSLFHISFSQCSREVAKAEIEQGVELAQRLGITPKSFVFPGNYIGHVDVLKSYGFQIYRSKDAGRYDIAQSFLVRSMNRAIDKAIAPPVLPSRKNSLWEISGSTYFCDSKTPFTLLPRAKLGLNRAIRANTVFHIWLHPWSLLDQPSLEKILGKFLTLVAKKRDEDKLQVMTMGELASYLNKKMGEA